MPLFHPTKSGVSVTVRVTPRAGKTAIAGVGEDVLLVKLAAGPVDGAGKEALVALLTAAFQIPKRDVVIVSGVRSRIKRVELAGASAARMAEQLAARLAS